MKQSVTIVEVLVASVILALAFGGLFAAFIGARSYTTSINERIIASNLARRALENLYDSVSADTWESGDLSIANDNPLPEYNIDGQPYGDPAAPSSYDVTNVGTHDYRQVTVDIGYVTSAGGGGGTGGLEEED
jgi:type II secretory pathway pseudopilin PulG